MKFDVGLHRSRQADAIHEGVKRQTQHRHPPGDSRRHCPGLVVMVPMLVMMMLPVIVCMLVMVRMLAVIVFVVVMMLMVSMPVHLVAMRRYEPLDKQQHDYAGGHPETEPEFSDKTHGMR